MCEPGEGEFSIPKKRPDDAQPVTKSDMLDAPQMWSKRQLLELIENGTDVLRGDGDVSSLDRGVLSDRHFHNNITQYKDGTFFRFYCGECGETLSEGGKRGDSAERSGRGEPDRPPRDLYINLSHVVGYQINGTMYHPSEVEIIIEDPGPKKE